MNDTVDVEFILKNRTSIKHTITFLDEYSTEKEKDKYVKHIIKKINRAIKYKRFFRTYVTEVGTIIVLSEVASVTFMCNYKKGVTKGVRII